SSSSLRPPPTSTLLPYTTLFRSEGALPGHTAPRTSRVFPGAADVLSRSRIRPPRARVCGIWAQPPLASHNALEGEREPERPAGRSEEHTSELQSRSEIVCRLLLE